MHLFDLSLCNKTKLHIILAHVILQYIIHGHGQTFKGEGPTQFQILHPLPPVPMYAICITFCQFSGDNSEFCLETHNAWIFVDFLFLRFSENKHSHKYEIRQHFPFY